MKNSSFFVFLVLLLWHQEAVGQKPTAPLQTDTSISIVLRQYPHQWSNGHETSAVVQADTSDSKAKVAIFASPGFSSIDLAKINTDLPQVGALALDSASSSGHYEFGVSVWTQKIRSTLAFRIKVAESKIDGTSEYYSFLTTFSADTKIGYIVWGNQDLGMYPFIGHSLLYSALEVNFAPGRLHLWTLQSNLTFGLGGQYFFPLDDIYLFVGLEIGYNLNLSSSAFESDYTPPLRTITSPDLHGFWASIQFGIGREL